MIITRNLLQHNLDEDELLAYLEKRPTMEWFNPNAPLIKSGALDPHTLSAQKALTLLLNDPILIRRPLMNVEGERMCGFDTQTIETVLGISLQGKEEEKCASNTACFSPVASAAS
jgi:nitrogenase-associated protein